VPPCLRPRLSIGAMQWTIAAHYYFATSRSRCGSATPIRAIKSRESGQVKPRSVVTSNGLDTEVIGCSSMLPPFFLSMPQVCLTWQPIRPPTRNPPRSRSPPAIRPTCRSHTPLDCTPLAYRRPNNGIADAHGRAPTIPADISASGPRNPKQSWHPTRRPPPPGFCFFEWFEARPAQRPGQVGLPQISKHSCSLLLRRAPARNELAAPAMLASPHQIGAQPCRHRAAVDLGPGLDGTVLLGHELFHVVQQRDMGWLRFLAAYLRHWRPKHVRRGWEHPYEVPAYARGREIREALERA
jgi:hypothetical protein